MRRESVLNMQRISTGGVAPLNPRLIATTPAGVEISPAQVQTSRLGHKSGHCLWPLAILALLLSATAAHAAEPPEIAVQAGASEIFAGESVDYIVEIRNVKKPPAPDVEALREDFDVVARGNESHNQSTVMSFNGQVTERNSFSHVFRFRLTPKRPGNLTIPGPSATIDGKTISG